MLQTTKLKNLVYSDLDAVDKKLGVNGDQKIGRRDAFKRVIDLIQYMEQSPVYAVTTTSSRGRRTHFIELSHVQRRELMERLKHYDVKIRRVDHLIQPDMTQLIDLVDREHGNQENAA